MQELNSVLNTQDNTTSFIPSCADRFAAQFQESARKLIGEKRQILTPCDNIGEIVSPLVLLIIIYGLENVFDVLPGVERAPFLVDTGRMEDGRRVQNQGELDAILLVEDKKGNLWVYEKLVTNVRLSVKTTDTKIEYLHLYSLHHYFPTGTQFMQPGRHVDTDITFSAQPAARSPFFSFIVGWQQRAGHQLQTTAPDGQTERHSGISHTGSPRACLGATRLWSDDQYHLRTY